MPEGGDKAQQQGEERQAIYNTEALHDRLEDISWVEEHPWEATQVISQQQPTTVANIDDDLERELAFYNQVAHLWLPLHLSGCWVGAAFCCQAECS